MPTRCVYTCWKSWSPLHILLYILATKSMLSPTEIARGKPPSRALCIFLARTPGLTLQEYIHVYYSISMYKQWLCPCIYTRCVYTCWKSWSPLHILLYILATKSMLSPTEIARGKPHRESTLYIFGPYASDNPTRIYTRSRQWLFPRVYTRRVYTRWKPCLPLQIYIYIFATKSMLSPTEIGRGKPPYRAPCIFLARTSGITLPEYT